MDEAAEAYTRVVLALGERDSDSLDMYRGPAAWQEAARARHATLDAIRADAESLFQRLDAAPDADSRRAFLARQLRAVIARVDVVKGARPSFADETRRLFDFAVEPASSDDPDKRRRELDSLLPGTGDLVRRYAEFDRHYVVPPDRLEAVLRHALAGCRAATAAHSSLPTGEKIDLQFVRDIPWSAFTRYQGGFVSRVTINADMQLTVDRALDLACHEGYPGHHFIYAQLESQFGASRPELLVQPQFSPQSMLHEAASANAPMLAFTDADRLAFERDNLFPLASLPAADAERYVRVSRLADGLYGEELRILAAYLDGELDFPRAASALERDALMSGADATLKFANQFRSYVATYTAGRDAFRRVVQGDWSRYLRIVADPAQRIPPPAGVDHP